MVQPQIVMVPVGDLKPRPNNPRTHSKAQLKQLARSMQRYDFTNPILVDDDNVIIAGHGRWEAAKMLDLTEVPVIRLSGMSPADIRAYVIADNKLALNAGWDAQLLGSELAYLAELDFDFDLTLTGFELAEVDALIQGTGEVEGPDPADELPAPSDAPTVTRPGDIWQIGPHRLICGDSTKPETYTALMEGEQAGVAFADAPYNVPISGHVSGFARGDFELRHGVLREAAELSALLTRAQLGRAEHGDYRSRSSACPVVCAAGSASRAKLPRKAPNRRSTSSMR